ncbi:DUF5816 domain-containing protein [Halolamina sp. CBA1230]|uniref:DUF5816 domain-containing protein n=1 Tax=Halolamina sp. CBA1230 TaxID=1853690 RepID=UPI001C3DF1D8|nr:DUF5816 domain-containing protein [Halolamina sp. CBA1230]
MQLEAIRTADGETVYVDHTDGEKGSKAPFLVAYVSEAGEERWGYFCGNCETTDNAMDAMGRIECNVCGNVKKPDEWDAAHE